MSSVICYECGSELKVHNSYAEVDYNDDVIISLEVEPCPKCMGEFYTVDKEDGGDKH